MQCHMHVFVSVVWQFVAWQFCNMMVCCVFVVWQCLVCCVFVYVAWQSCNVLWSCHSHFGLRHSSISCIQIPNLPELHAMLFLSCANLACVTITQIFAMLPSCVSCRTTSCDKGSIGGSHLTRWSHFLLVSAMIQLPCLSESVSSTAMGIPQFGERVEKL